MVSCKLTHQRKPPCVSTSCKTNCHSSMAFYLCRWRLLEKKQVQLLTFLICFYQFNLEHLILLVIWVHLKVVCFLSFRVSFLSQHVSTSFPSFNVGLLRNIVHSFTPTVLAVCHLFSPRILLDVSCFY